MFTKTCFAAIAASLLIAPLGVAYGVGTEDQKTQDMSKAPNASNLTEWTKAEAMKNGITEQQFTAADKNHDGKLDQTEIKGAGLEVKEKSSK
jgi:hypothetical protein